MNVHEEWDSLKLLYSELRPTAGEPTRLQEKLAFAKQEFPIDAIVKVKYTSYKGVVTGYNMTLGGFYPGERYPVYVKILDDGELGGGLHKVVGETFEYSCECLEIEK
jgi:hypothetical protein